MRAVLTSPTARLHAPARALVRTDASVAPTALRLALGAVLFPHGAQHLFGWFGGYGLDATLAWMTGTLGIPAVVAALAIVTEFVAPLLLIAGLATRPAAFALAVFMTGAAATHFSHGFFMNWFGSMPAGTEGFEYHLLAVAMAGSLAVSGGGAASADRILSRGWTSALSDSSPNDGATWTTPRNGTAQRLVAGIALLLMMACADDSTGPGGPPETEPVWSVAVEPAELTLTAGQTQRMGAQLRSRAGKPLTGRTVTWSAADPRVVTVDEAGTVTALSPGWTTLTAVAEGRTGRATVRVSAAHVPVAAVEIRPTDAITLVAGQSVALDAVLRAADGSELIGRVVTWTAAPAAHAVVSETGVVLARQAGIALISATSEGVTTQKSITIAAPAVPVARLEPTTGGVVTLTTGATAQLGVRALAADSTEITGRVVTWSSSDPAVAVVSATGLVSARGVGSADVTAELDGHEVTIAIDVRSLVARIEVDAADLVLAPGQERLVRAIPRAEDGTALGRPLSWQSDDPAVVRVDDDGRIVAVAAGGTVVRVTTEGVEGRVDVRVVEWVRRPLLAIDGAPLPAVLLTRVETAPGGEPRRTVVEARSGEFQLALTGMNSGSFRLEFGVSVTTDDLPPALGQYGYGGTWQADLATGTLILTAYSGERLVAQTLAGGALIVRGRIEPGAAEVELAYGTR